VEGTGTLSTTIDRMLFLWTFTVGPQFNDAWARSRIPSSKANDFVARELPFVGVNYGSTPAIAQRRATVGQYETFDYRKCTPASCHSRRALNSMATGARQTPERSQNDRGWMEHSCST
jgi:hypothetical protein